MGQEGRGDNEEAGIPERRCSGDPGLLQTSNNSLALRLCVMAQCLLMTTWLSRWNAHLREGADSEHGS